MLKSRHQPRFAGHHERVHDGAVDVPLTVRSPKRDVIAPIGWPHHRRHRLRPTASGGFDSSLA